MADEVAAIVHNAADFYQRNTMLDQYEGMLVHVAFDPNFTDFHGDVGANPTGKTYRLLPLEQCDLTVNSWGNDNSHWVMHSSGAAVAVLPGMIRGGKADPSLFQPGFRF